MASCKCGGGQCSCVVIAGPGATVTGAGSTANPYVVGADPNVTAGCGITGDGSAANPLTANTQTWPFTCDIGANGGGVYCDPATGELHTDPPVWGEFEGNQQTTALSTPLPVPTSASQVIDTISITVTNPDPCRRALGFLFREVDLDFTLPPNSGAMASIDGDDMNYLGNQGSGTIFATHSQDNKITVLTLNPGETRTITMNVEAGRGSGGATITRIQKSLRAWFWTPQFN